MEMGGKISMMGIYSGTYLLASPPPLVMPSLCIQATAVTDIEYPFEKLGIVVTAFGKPIFERPPSELPEISPTVQNPTKLSVSFITTLSPFKVPEFGEVSVEFLTEEDPLPAGRLSVMAADTVPVSPS